MEDCARIPGSYKLRGLTTKYILKRAARGVVPQWVIDRPKVGFFDTAVDAWCRAQARAAIEHFLGRSDPACGELLDRGEIQNLIRQTTEPRPRDARLLLSILMLEVWLSTYLPRALRAASAAAAA